jgi:hypothetical protein
MGSRFHPLMAMTAIVSLTNSSSWNLHPYGTRLRRDQPSRVSPFHDLNGVQYHPNWLHNLLIASSMGGLRH